MVLLLFYFLHCPVAKESDCHHNEQPSSSHTDISSYESVQDSGFHVVSQGFYWPTAVTELAYWKNRGIDDAILLTLNNIYSHLKTAD